MQRPVIAVLAVAAVLFAAACGGDGGRSTDARTTPSQGQEGRPSPSSTADLVACGGRGPGFPQALLDGQILSRDEFRERPAGAVMHEFFTEGQGSEIMADDYDRAEGFIIVEERRRILSVESDRIATRFRLGDRDGRLQVRGWGGCPVRHIEGELSAAPWQPAEPVSPDDEQLEIAADGGECVNIEGSATELVRVDVTESAETVTITTWTRDPPTSGDCAGVGLSLESTVELDEPLGSRTLIDGGLVPPTPVDEAAL